MIISLHGKVAVICGSTQGIGRAIAEAFAEAGASCWLVARNAKELQNVKSALSTSAQQDHREFVADFSKPGDVANVIESIVATGFVDILVNNTGGPKPGPVTEAKPEDFAAGFQQHILVNQQFVQALLPGMRQKKFGRIINIVSTSVRIPLNNLGVSNTIRAAVAGWAKTLSNEVGKDNITVNNILPGFTETARLDSLIDGMVKSSGKQREDIIAGLEKEIPMGRFGKPAELANLAVFLASQAASYITGTNIPVDGGRTGSI